MFFQTHACIEKAKLIGLVTLRLIETDDDGVIDTVLLTKAIEVSKMTVQDQDYPACDYMLSHSQFQFFIFSIFPHTIAHY